MSVFGYIFMTLEEEHRLTAEDQQIALYDYAKSIGLKIGEIFVEQATPLQQPFGERTEGSRLVSSCVSGDSIITLNAAWILSSAGEGKKLLKMLRENDIALYCMDLGANITVDEKRKLVVSEGCAGIVEKLLSALSVCESSNGGDGEAISKCESNKHGKAIRATKRSLKQQGKYTGGPVPFGWEVNEERIFVQNKEEQKIIQAITKMREGRWSYRDISKKLDAEYNIQLSHTRVRRILDSDKKKKEAFAGLKDKR